MEPPSRRQVLGAGALGALWLGAGCGRRTLSPPSSRVDPAEAVTPDVEFSLRTRRSQAVIDRAGDRMTNVWRFEGSSFSGSAPALSAFLLRPGERVRIRVRFARHAGLFLYHCHNLEQEDMGMMRNFRVEI